MSACSGKFDIHQLAENRHKLRNHLLIDTANPSRILHTLCTYIHNIGSRIYSGYKAGIRFYQFNCD